MLSIIHSLCMSLVTEHRISKFKQAHQNDNRKLE